MLPRSLLYMILAFTAPCMGIVTPTNAAADFQNIRVGIPFTISWSGATGDVTIALLLASGTTVVTIGTAITGNSYIWTPPALSRTDRYTLQFIDQTLIESQSPSFDFGGEPVPSDRDASVLLVTTTTFSQLLTSTVFQTSTPILESTPTMSSSLISSTVVSQQPSSTTISAVKETSTSHHRGLSTGAKAGISVGAVLGAFLLIFLVLLGFWIGRRTSQNANNDGNGNEMQQNHVDRNWYGREKPNYDPSSTNSRHNLLRRGGDDRSGTMGTFTTGGRSSRMDTMTFSDGGRSSRFDTMTMTDGRNSRLTMISPTPLSPTQLSPTTDARDWRRNMTTPEPLSPILVSPLRMSPVDGRTPRVSVLSDGRRSRIGRFEFEDRPDIRGFSGGIRIVEMEDFRI